MDAIDKLESLMESYYGMQDEETAAREAHDIDSGAFDVAGAAGDLVRRATLPVLQAKERELIDQTRGLDGEMQALVFNNYNKFIGATDTIRHMKDSVGDMEAKMSGLVTDMRQMGGSSATVNASLQENRSRIEKLVGVKRLLLKLEFLFDLPSRLKRSIELDAQEQAVRYYTMVSGVLRRYDHIPSLHRIRVEADAIINGLRAELRATVRDTRAMGSGRVVDAIKLLVQLDEPRAALRAHLLAHQRARLTAALHSHIARYASPAATPAAAGGAGGSGAAGASPAGGAGLGSPSALLSDRAAALYAAAAAPAAAAGAGGPGAANPLTSPSARPRATVSPYAYLQTLNRVFLDSFKIGTDLFVELFEGPSIPDTAEGAEEKRIAHEELLAFTRDLFGEYFTAVRAQLSLPPPPLGEGEAAEAAPRRTPGAAANPFMTRAGRRGEARLATGADGDDEDTLMAAAEAAKAQALAAAAAMGNDGPQARFTPVTDALTMLLSDVRSCTRNVKEAKLIDRAQESIEAILRAQLDGLFGDLRAEVVRECGDLHAYSAKLLAEERAKAAAAEASVATAAMAGEDSAAGAALLTGTKRYDWMQTVGAGLAAAAERASTEVSRRIVDALTEAKPLVLNGMRLLPELARIFNSLVHGQVLNVLMWLASAWEALGDPFHPCRVEYAAVVVEADLQLERELAPPRGGAAGRGGRPGHRHAPSMGGGGGGLSGAAALKRRVTVNFAAAGAASGDANGYVTGTALMDPASNQPVFLLLLASLCRHFAANGVAAALDAMIKSLPTRGDLAGMGVSLSDTELESYGAMTDVPDLIKRMQAAGRELLRQYVFQHSTRLAAVIRRSLTSSDWLAHKEPSGPRLVVKVVLEAVAEVKKLAACTLGDWDARGALAAAGAYGVGTATLAPPSPAGASGGGGSSSSNPFGPAPPAGAGNPFASPTAPVTLRAGLASGANPATLALAQAARRTGVVVGATGTAAGGGAPAPAPAAGMGTLSGLGAALATGGGGGGSGGGGGGRGALGLDVDRLFRGSGGAGDAGASAHIVLGIVDYTSDSVVRVLLRTLLKAWLEWVRDATLSAGGYQQIQVDLAAVHLALPFFVAGPPPAAALATATSAVSGGWDPYASASLLEELINEAAVTGSERCVDPRPLEVSIVHRLAADFVAALEVPL